MLLNPIVSEHIDEFDFSIIKGFKKEVLDRVSFDIDEKNKTIIFPESNKKEAIKEFIKLVSMKYSKSINKNHIIEGIPAKVIK